MTANLDWLELPEGRTNTGFVITIAHAGGAHSHVSASKVNRTESRELRVFGALGSYVSSQTDVQAQAIFAGVRPVDDLGGWGYEVAERWGTLSTADGTRVVPSAQGRYADYYTSFAAAVAGGGPQPVPAARRWPPWPFWTPPASARTGASRMGIVKDRDICEAPATCVKYHDMGG